MSAISCLLPLSGQGQEPLTTDAKFRQLMWTSNQRSAQAIERRRIKRIKFRLKNNSAFRKLKSALKTFLPPAEIKSRLKQLRMDRKGSALDRLPNDIPKKIDGNQLLIDNITPCQFISNNAMRDNSINNLTKSVISPRKLTFIGTLNTRSLKAKWKLYELVNYCMKNRIKILAIQEHRIYFDAINGELFRKQNLGGGWWFIYSTASSAGVGGVGFILSSEVYSNLRGVYSVSDRIMLIKLGNSDFKSCIYSIYSPTSTANVDDVKNFFTVLSDSVQAIPLSEMTIIMGDFNSTLLSNEKTRYSPNRKSNRNGPILDEFLEDMDFIAINSIFKKCPKKLISFYGPNNRKVTLDYILLRPKWVRSVQDCNSKNPTTIASDHNMIVMKLKWRLKNNKPKPKTRKNYSFLNINNKDEASLRISQEVTDDILCKFIMDPLIGVENYGLFVKAINNSIASHLPQIERTNSSHIWVDDDIQKLRELYITSRLKYQRYKSPQNKEEMGDLARKLSDLYIQKYQLFINTKCAQIQACSGSSQAKLAWDTINSLTGRKARTSGIIAAEDDKERLKAWHAHFKGLLSPKKKPVRKDLHLPKTFNKLSSEFRTGKLTKDELFKALQSLKTNKASGVDEVVAEVLKRPELFQIILDILNLCYDSKTVPTEFHISLIIPVFKKGNPSLCDNYRGIALMSVCAKLYNSILFYRVRDVLDPLLKSTQNGFRSLRSTAQHVLAWRRIYEETISTKNAKLISVFIDFRKAFDSVNWNFIENILYSYDVPAEIIKAIMSLYYGAKAAVKVDGSISEYFELGIGVLQGDTLAPFLFIIVLDWVLRNAIPDDSLGVLIQPSRGTRSRPIPPKHISNLAFADDICLISTDPKNMQTMLSAVEEWALKIGLKINLSKTVFLLSGDWTNFNSKKSVKLRVKLKLKSGNLLKEVQDFKYLGTWLMNSVNDFKVRKAAAWTAIRGLNRIWRSKLLDDKTKFNLFQSLIVSILLYNAVTWTVNKTLTRYLNSAYNKLLRYALDITYTPGTRLMTNEQMYVKHHITPITKVLQLRRLTFAGHCYRSYQTAPQPISDVLFLQFQGTRKRGNRSNYRKILCLETGFDETQLQNEMLNRDNWRKLIKNIVK